MKPWFAFIGILLSVTVSGQENSVGIFDGHRDIGHVKHAGSSGYDAATQQYSISGAGANIWNNDDQFHFTFKKISGDFILTANFEFSGDTTAASGHRKIGWMVRESLAPDAASMDACVHLDGLTV